MRERSAPRSTAPRRRGTIYCWFVGLARAFRFAFAGIGHLVRTQRNAQIHLAATFLVVIAGVLLQVSAGEWTALILSMTLVWTFEALNTAMEALVDLVTLEPHPLAKTAKDVAASTVLLAAIGAAAVGAVIFVPKLWQLWQTL
jgi:diacylglycerol kinase (ATP)